jgi:hypothetical protein
MPLSGILQEATRSGVLTDRSSSVGWRPGSSDLGVHEPQPAVFLYKRFAENYDLFVHTIQEKGSAMGWNHKEKKQGAVRFQTPVFAVPPPPYPLEAVLGQAMNVTVME